jgi:hypothetical protein
VYLQYLLGFQRLGWDVLFVDWLGPGMCTDDRGRPSTFAASHNLAYFEATMRDFGLDGRYSLLDEATGATHGLPREAVAGRLRESALLLNVMGYLQDPDLLSAPTRRVFLDIDPGFTQMWRALGLADLLAGHDAFVTVGEAIGTPDCTIPTCDVEWVTTPPPVVLDLWPVSAAPARDVTGIGAWRGPNAPVEFEGRTYGLRVHEFRQFAELPRRVDSGFEYALEIHPDEIADIDRLRTGGWRLVDPLDVARDPFAYRRYIQESMVEFMVAKAMYVDSRSGWFSDRSACYLASGRPVVAQDTGGDFACEAGLLTYIDADSAVAALEDVRGDYTRHSRAARAIAEARFDSDVVLSRLLDRLGVA